MERESVNAKFLMYVSPFTTRYEWKIFKSPWRLLCVLAIGFFMVMVELNQFLIINSFGIPNTSQFVVLRLVMAGLLSVPAIAEWYDYVEDVEKMSGRKEVRLGPSIWIMVCMIFVELAVTIKFFPNHMRDSLDKVGNPMYIPYNVLIPHLITLALVSLWAVLRYKVIGYNTIELATDKEQEVMTNIVSKTNKTLFSQNDQEMRVTKRKRFSNFMKLPFVLQRKVLMVELVDLLLFFAFLPMCYLFYIGWKWV
mmetsp:Transcript_2250/g.2892  ORF Transcript_2250/g.2892 Transcript_2250/m.2892 type:complete len:252 (+) Transcript_2250:3-758(+)